ncbi:hypothetical protein [Chitinibacter sp. S2-10]|uniref:hypothetical protein n=1 Tax=Chitinibacter sp. S2-10 TaxID=3373597 RepID=UPI0039777A4E
MPPIIDAMTYKSDPSPHLKFADANEAARAMAQMAEQLKQKKEFIIQQGMQPAEARQQTAQKIEQATSKINDYA